MEETLADVRGGSTSTVEGDEPGMIGRYTVLRRLGEGGMGVVFAAYDTDLDRKVAVKLLHRDVRDGPDQSVGTSRLVREAQAMAKIDHPNVLQVFEAGTHRGRVFLALEYVDGSTLGEWCSAAPRSWREVLGMFLQAGEGLHAAHTVGIVHRDFKPGNVLVDRRGRVRVMDFGLARGAGQSSERSGVREVPLALRSSVSLELSLTQTGAAIGTPAYMAPEQFQSLETDARTDEFSFCVALWEALYGVRPFAGEGLTALIGNVLSGHLTEPPRGSKVPRWIRRVLLRGLSVEPAARYPSLAALLAALRADPAIVHRRVAAGALVCGALAGGIYGGVVLSSADDVCAGGVARFAEVWDEGRAAAVEASFAASARPYAAATAAHVREMLDGYAEGWAQGYRDACEAHLRGEQSAELLDRRMSCLDRRRDEVTALLGVFSGADGPVVDKAVDATLRLGDLAACSDRDQLRGDVEAPTTAEQAAEVLAIRRRLDLAEAATRAGRYKQALEAVEAGVRAAEEQAYRPLQAEAALVQARVLMGLSRYEDAYSAAFRAVWAAEASRHERVAAEAWLVAMKLAGVDLAKFEDAAHWRERATAALARLGDPAALRYELYVVTGSVATTHRRFEDALADASAALEVLSDAPSDDFRRARALNNLGNAKAQLGQLAEAEVDLRRALELRQRVLGADHPDVASTHNNLGVVLRRASRLDDADAEYALAGEIWTRSQGPDNPALVNALQNRASVAMDRGDREQATQWLVRAEALAVRTLPPNSPLLGAVRANLGVIRVFRSEYAAAEALLRQELARREAVYGPGNDAVVEVLLNLGSVVGTQGRYAEARELLSDSMISQRPMNERVSPLLNVVALDLAADDLPAAERHLRELAEARVETGDRRGEAFSMMLEADLALRRRKISLARERLLAAARLPADPWLQESNLAVIDFIRAQILWASGERAEAIQAAESSRAIYRKYPELDPPSREKIEAWLAKRRG